MFLSFLRARIDVTKDTIFINQIEFDSIVIETTFFFLLLYQETTFFFFFFFFFSHFYFPGFGQNHVLRTRYGRCIFFRTE